MKSFKKFKFYNIDFLIKLILNFMFKIKFQNDSRKIQINLKKTVSITKRKNEVKVNRWKRQLGNLMLSIPLWNIVPQVISRWEVNLKSAGDYVKAICISRRCYLDQQINTCLFFLFFSLIKSFDKIYFHKHRPVLTNLGQTRIKSFFVFTESDQLKRPLKCRVLSRNFKSAQEVVKPCSKHKEPLPN